MIYEWVSEKKKLCFLRSPNNISFRRMGLCRYVCIRMGNWKIYRYLSTCLENKFQYIQLLEDEILFYNLSWTYLFLINYFNLFIIFYFFNANIMYERVHLYDYTTVQRPTGTHTHTQIVYYKCTYMIIWRINYDDEFH